MLLVVLIVLAVLLFGGGYSSRGHDRYGSYSMPGMGLGGMLLLLVLLLWLTGNIRI